MGLSLGPSITSLLPSDLALFLVTHHLCAMLMHTTTIKRTKVWFNHATGMENDTGQQQTHMTNAFQ